MCLKKAERYFSMVLSTFPNEIHKSRSYEVLLKLQKFQDSLKADIESDTKLFLQLLEQAGGVQGDMEKLGKYMELAKALSSYAPVHKFKGNAVLVQATETISEATLPIPNEDYNVSKVMCTVFVASNPFRLMP